MKKAYIKNICLLCILSIGINLFSSVGIITAKAATADVLFTYVKSNEMDVLQAKVPTPVPTAPQPTLIPKANMVIEFLDGTTTTQQLTINGVDWTKYYNSADPAATTQQCTVSYGEYSGSAKNKTPYVATVYVQLLGEFAMKISSKDSVMGLVQFTTPTSTSLSASATQKVRVGSDCTIKAVANSGYSFTGWYSNTTKYSTNATYTFPMPASELNLTAQWEANKYTVTFDANGGECSENSRTVTFASKYGTLPIPIRKGYSFNGWFLDNQQILSTDAVSTSANHTLKAKWTANQYKITFDANTGTMPNSAPVSMMVTYDDLYGSNLPSIENGNAPTKPGYTFNGWRYGVWSISKNTRVKTATAHTLIADWIGNAVPVSLDANGGTCAVSNVSVHYKSTYGTLPKPTKENYIFAGWTHNGSFVTESTVVTTLTEHTLKAEWLSTNESSKEVRYDDPYGTLPNPLRSGYEFAGWFLEEDINHYAMGKSVYSYTIVKTADDHWIYARWVPRTFTVDFDENGGSACSTITVQYDHLYGALPIPVRDNYVFAGWYTAEVDDNGFGDQITSETIVKTLDNQMLFAKWIEDDTVEEQTLTVTFDANGGSCALTSKVVVFDKEYGELPVPTRAGYTFKNWIYNETTPIITTSIVGIANNHTLVAKWEANKYTVTLDDQNIDTTKGDVWGDKTVVMTFDQLGPDINIPKRTSYLFMGYYSGQNGSDTQYFDKFRQSKLNKAENILCHLR